jgi:hypothetical protein
MRRIMIPSQPGQIVCEALSRKQNKIKQKNPTKQGEQSGSSGKHLPSKGETLSSKPSASGKKKRIYVPGMGVGRLKGESFLVGRDDLATLMTTCDLATLMTTT